MIALQASGQEVPALDGKPELAPWNVPIYKAFFVLSSSRAIYMGAIGNIPFSEIASYAAVFRVASDAEELQDFVEMIQKLDEVYVAWSNDPERRKERQFQQASGALEADPEQSPVAGSKVRRRRRS